MTSEYEYDTKIVKGKEARINEYLCKITDEGWEHGNIDVRLSDENIKSYLIGNMLLDYDLEVSLQKYRNCSYSNKDIMHIKYMYYMISLGIKQHGSAKGLKPLDYNTIPNKSQKVDADRYTLGKINTEELQETSKKELAKRDAFCVDKTRNEELYSDCAGSFVEWNRK